MLFRSEGFIDGETKSFEANFTYVSTVPGEAKATTLPSAIREKFAAFCAHYGYAPPDGRNF